MSSLFRKSPLEYQIRRSARRKTVAIEVRPGEVRVLAPHAVTQSWIDAFVCQKEHWIRSRLAAFAKHPLPPQPSIDDGASLLWLGKSYRLQVVDNQPVSGVTINGATLELQLSRRLRRPRAEAIKQQLELWYRDTAQIHITQRVQHWSALMGAQPAEISVRSYRRKWGCCTSRAQVRFNWLLVMAAPEIIDYVVIHELSHLRHMNHSAQFWARVTQFCPDYKRAQAWLRQEGGRLQW